MPNLTRNYNNCYKVSLFSLKSKIFAELFIFVIPQDDEVEIEISRPGEQ